VSLVRVYSNLKHVVGIILVFSMLASSPAFASADAITPESAHQKIVKVGAGNWIWVQERSGVSLHGIVTNIGSDTFGIQLYNDPASVTTISYSDVVKFRAPVSKKTAIIVVASAVGVFVGVGFLLHHEYETHVNQMPTLP
jgi:hypothetical protein